LEPNFYSNKLKLFRHSKIPWLNLNNEIA
jgi:hypothetical protein